MHRKISLLPLSLFLFLLVIAPLPAVEPPSVERAGGESAPAEKLVIGEVEYVAIPLLDSVFAARIDTGAKTTAIYAVDIETFERDGKPWARFTIKNPHKDNEFPLEMEVARTARVKQEGRESERRMGVTLDLTIGEITKRLTVSLADRSGFEYPLLIGRDFLSGSAVVDVTRKFTQKTPGAPNISKKRSK
jgi:hypothetical protein